MTRLALALPVAAVLTLSACAGGTKTVTAPPAATAPATTAAAPSTPAAPASPTNPGTTTIAAPPPPATVTQTVQQTTTAAAPTQPPATQPPAQSGCGTQSASEAAAANIGKVPQTDPNPRMAWSLKTADLKGYDACAPLSYIPITIDMASSSSPWQIMLFNRGQYLGTATAKAYGFMPDIVRRSPSSIQVTYKYVKPGESNAEGSGRSVSTFTWDAAQQKVIWAGETPDQRA